MAVLRDNPEKILDAKGFRSTAGQLSIPDGLLPVKFGTTGMLYSQAHSYSPNDVLSFIIKRANDFPPYEAEVWDCEDFAFLAAAEVRFQFPGQPIGIAIGIAKHPPAISGRLHAVNYLWFMGQNDKKPNCNTFEIFDSTLPIPEFIKNKGGFDVHSMIPIPVSVTNNHKDCPPADQLQFINSASFQLDRLQYDFNSIGDVKKDLQNQVIKLQKPLTTEFMSEKKWNLMKSIFWSDRDEAFYVFAQIRRMHKRAPVGVAFGMLTTPMASGESGALVLWSSPNQCEFWDYGRMEPLPPIVKFKPRIVIV